jgi:hypothetical protein
MLGDVDAILATMLEVGAVGPMVYHPCPLFRADATIFQQLIIHSCDPL